MSNVIDAVFKLTDEFSTPMQNCLTALTDAGRQGKNARKQIAKVGDTISKVGAGLTAGVTTPIIGMAATSVKEFGEVDSALRLVQQTMGSTDEEAAVLTSAIKTAASNSTYGMQDAADAALNYARQGYNAAQAADMLTPAMDLAVGTATDLSTVTSGLGNAMKMFGADSSEAADYANVLAKAQAQANTTVTDLFDAMSTAGPMFKTVGWDIKDLSAAVDVLGNAGISGSEGANALKTGLSRLASPQKTNIKVVDKAVKSLFDENGQMKSLTETQKTLHDAFSGLTQEEKLNAASTLFGKNQMSKWLTLIDASPDELAGFESALQDVTETGNLAGDMAQSQMEGTGGAIERMKSAFDVLKYSAGDIVADYITPFLEKINSLLNKFNEMPEEQQKMIVKFAAIAAAIGPVLLVFGKLVTGASKLMGVFAGIKQAGGILSAVFGAITSPAGIVIAVIAAIVAVVAVLVTHIDQVKGSISNMLQTNSPQIQALGQAFQQLWATLQPVLEFIAGAFVQGVLGAFDALMSSPFLTSFITDITTMVEGITTVLQGLIDFIAGVFTGDWDRAWEGIKTAFSGVIDFMSGLINGFMDGLNWIIDGIGGAVEAVGNFITGKSGSKNTAKNASGTSYWRGGLTSVNESGGEIMNLPRGTQIIPHDLSRNMVSASGGQNVSISGNYFTVREEADIDKITDSLVRKMYRAQANMGTA